MTDKNLNNDFQQFSSSTHSSTPPETTKISILNFIKQELNPSHSVIFGKLIVIQAFIGLLTLIFCPQFNLSLTNNYELFHYLHHNFGEYICMMACGSIFMGSGAFFSTYLLTASEVSTLKKSKLLYYFGITSCAIIIFLLFGAEIYLNLAFFWIIGSVLAGSIIFEINREFS